MNLNFDIVKDLKERILVIDGAMGTNIQKFSLKEEDFKGELLKDFNVNQKGNNDLLNITKPEVIEYIHRGFLEAGADIIETNTINSNKVYQRKFNLENLVYELNYKGAQLAKKLCSEYEIKDGKKRYVAGAIGPTDKVTSNSLKSKYPSLKSIDFNELKEAYKEQINGLIDGGVDLLLIETIFDLSNAKAAITACNEVFKEKDIILPIMLSATIKDNSGEILSGENLLDFSKLINDENIIAIGLNCSFGVKGLLPLIKELSNRQSQFLSIYPNAGLPNKLGFYDETPEITKKFIEEMLKEGYINIVGGCCGTTFEHIRKIADTSKKYKPRYIN